MKPKVILFLFMIALVVVSFIGCSKPIVFAGQSSDWSVECSVSTADKYKQHAIKYIGNEGGSDSKVQYEFLDSHNFSDKGESSRLAKNLVMTGKSTLTSAYAEEDNLKVRISWNGKEETITLHKAK